MAGIRISFESLGTIQKLRKQERSENKNQKDKKGVMIPKAVVCTWKCNKRNKKNMSGEGKENKKDQEIKKHFTTNQEYQ